jgi:hypothetical protein
MATQEQIADVQGAAAPKKSVWRYLREDPYIAGLSMVSRSPLRSTP